MSTYFLKRLLLIPPTFVGIVFLSAGLVEMLPGAAEDYHWGASAAQAVDEAPNAYVAANATDTPAPPTPRRTWTRAVHALSGDFGYSLQKRAAVWTLLRERIVNSLWLIGSAVALLYMLAVPIGMLRAVHSGRVGEKCWAALETLLYATPGFLITYALLALTHGQSGFWAPVMAALLSELSALSFLSKQTFVQEFAKAYVVTARAKGLDRPQILQRHLAPNASMVLLARLPQTVAHLLLSSSLVVEILFDVDGLASLGFDAIITRDIPVLLGVVCVYAALGLLLQVISDLAYTAIDPRMHFEAAS